MHPYVVMDCTGLDISSAIRCAFANEQRERVYSSSSTRVAKTMSTVSLLLVYVAGSTCARVRVLESASVCYTLDTSHVWFPGS